MAQSSPERSSKFSLGSNDRVFVIAEIGQNHQGDLKLAKKLIKLAKDSGADCVKFQKSSLIDRFTNAKLSEPYVGINSFGSTYGEHRKALEFNNDQFCELQRHANELDIMFTASPMDNVSADFLETLNVPFIKIGSGDTNNFHLIQHVSKKRIPIILSTGMQELSSVGEAVNIILKVHSNLCILHCVSAYPPPFDEVNLRVIELYKEMFPGIPIGYSSHEKGINVVIGAVALGAKVIEKHFTLDSSLKGTDHKCSLEPAEFALMVNGIREVEKAIGIRAKEIRPSEIPCFNKLSKSIVAANDLKSGQILSIDDILVKVSIPLGIPPQHYFAIVGKKLLVDLTKDTALIFDHIDGFSLL